MKMTVKTRMAFLIGMIFSVVILVTTAIFYKQSSEILNRDAEIRMAEQLDRAKENVSLLLSNIILETEKLSYDRQILDFFDGVTSVEEMNAYFDALMYEKNESRPVYMDLFLMSKEGEIVSAAVDSAIGNVDGNKRWYFKNAKKTGQTSTSDVITSQATSTQIVITMTPISLNNEIVGYFGLAIHASYFASFLENFEVNNNEYIILDSFDHIVSHPEKSLIKTEFDFFDENKEKFYQFSKVTAHEQDYFVMMKDLGFKEWKIISVLQRDEIYSKSRALAYTYIKVGIFLVFIAILVGFYVMDYVTKPIINITNSINKIIEEEEHHKDQIMSQVPDVLLHMEEETVEISNFKKAVLGFKETLEETTRSFEVEHHKLRDYVKNVDDELSNINRRNLEFISTLSHDIRSPLTLIKGYASGLSLEVLTDDDMLEKFKGNIIESANNIEYLVFDVLDFVYEVSDQHIYQMKNMTVTDFVEKLCGDLRQLFSEHERITYTTDVFAHEYVHVDMMQILRVLINLINNSVKYSSEQDRIDIRFKHKAHGLYIEVYDEGTGVKLEDQANIFEMFYRGDNREDVKGYGLGLYISSEIIKRHQSYIHCDSVFNDYTKMYFEIPYVEAI